MAAIGNVQSCDLNRTPNIHTYSPTAGGTGRVMGTDDWTATLRQSAIGTDKFANVGVTGTFTITPGTGATFVAPAIIVSISRVYNRQTGDIVEFVYEIAANGAVTTDLTGGSGTTAYSGKNTTFDWT